MSSDIAMILTILQGQASMGQDTVPPDGTGNEDQDVNIITPPPQYTQAAQSFPYCDADSPPEDAQTTSRDVMLHPKYNFVLIIPTNYDGKTGTSLSTHLSADKTYSQ